MALEFSLGDIPETKTSPLPYVTEVNQVEDAVITVQDTVNVLLSASTNQDFKIVVEYVVATTDGGKVKWELSTVGAVFAAALIVYEVVTGLALPV